MRQIVNDIIESIEKQPERWRFSFCTWKRDDGLEIWRANLPMLNISIWEPQELGLTLWEKASLYWAFRKWQKLTSLEQFMRKGGA